MTEDKIAYVCSRYSASTEEVFEAQLQTTKDISRVLVADGYDVIVPHLYYPLFLDDNDKEERKVGLESAIRLLNVCDMMFVYIGNKVSKGMEAEIQEAGQKNIDIFYFENINTLRDIIKRTTKRKKS